MNKARNYGFVFGLGLGLVQIGPAAYSAEVFFTPSQDCEDRIVGAFDSTKGEAVAAVYSINNERIVKAILAAHKRGVKVRILTDALQAAGASSKVLSLKAAGVELRVHSKHKIEHNKFAWFDGKVAVNGSFNWTEPASRENSENCVFFSESNILTAYKSRFEKLWELNTRDASIRKIAKLIEKARKRTPAGK